MFLYLLKFLAIVAAAAFGIYGSIITLKDEENKITTRGYIALSGVIGSAIVAGFLQIHEDKSSNQQALELLKKNNQILSDVRRTQNSLSGLEISYSLEPNWHYSMFSKVFGDKAQSIQSNKKMRLTLDLNP